MLRRTILATLAAMMVASTATAQTMCSKRSKFLDSLAQGYAESPVAMGLVSNGSVLEVLTSEKGTWTIIVTLPNGMSCVVASGEAWEEVERLALSEPAA